MSERPKPSWWRKWGDDILLVSGIACLSTAGFLLNPSAGLAALGGGLIALSIVVARAKGGDDG